MTVETMSPRPPTGWNFALMSPRYNLSLMMNVFVAIFSFGIIFLTFDIRARDVQNRIREVIDSLPVTNVEVIFGRLTGIVLLLLISCAVFLVIVAGYEFVTHLIGSRFRMGVEPMTVASLVVWNLVPNMVFYGALAACLSTLVRIRPLVAVIALGVLLGSLWIETQIPLRFQESLVQFRGSTLFPSDLAPVFVTPKVLGSKSAYLLIAVALLLFAASLLPRTDPRRALNTIIGFIACSTATLMFFGLVFSVYHSENRKEEWISLHRQQNPAAFPDVQQLTGTVELRPGRNISLDVTLTVLTPTTNTTDSVIFSLNPGYRVKKLYVDEEEVRDFNFDRGLLTVPAHELTEKSHEIRVVAKGRPNDRFAYLDPARDLQKITHLSIPRLGLRNAIFHDNYVALMPGIAWYPMSGSAIDRDHIETQLRDVFRTDLTVTVPKNWKVVTVGKRQVIETKKRSSFRFQSNAPLPELALIASRFEDRATTIEGIEFEVLFNNKHHKNFNILSPITDEILEWVSERIKSAQSLSLDYPYGAFYVVEVPSNLRVYGGGWRMDSVLQPPGLMLVRETAFPTAPFENELDQAFSRDSESQDEQHKRVFNALLRYFANDEQGGNPFAGFSRNFVSHQLSATQKGATVLQYLLDQLSKSIDYTTRKWFCRLEFRVRENSTTSIVWTNTGIPH